MKDENSPPKAGKERQAGNDPKQPEHDPEKCEAVFRKIMLKQGAKAR